MALAALQQDGVDQPAHIVVPVVTQLAGLVALVLLVPAHPKPPLLRQNLHHLRRHPQKLARHRRHPRTYPQMELAVRQSLA